MMRGNTIWYNLRQVYILVCPSKSTPASQSSFSVSHSSCLKDKCRAQVSGRVSMNKSKAAECVESYINNT